MKKSGFTLAELLAVLTILAIIALIATPNVINMIKQAKISTISVSTNNYVKGVNTILLSQNKYPKNEEKSLCKIIVNNNESYIECTHLDEPLLIDIDGNKPTGGIIELQNNEIIEYEIDIEGQTIYSKEPTPSDCFETSENADGTLTITKYLCGSTSSKKILDVVIPKRINGKKVTSIGGASFRNNGITSVVIPEGIENFTGYYCFTGNKLTSLKLPSTLKNISYGAFSSNNLTSIEIPEGVTAIGYSAFQNNKLANLIIPYGVKVIGDAAFMSNKLTSVTIKGKSSKSDFTSYPSTSPFGWASGYSDENIIWEQ